ncbi:MAG: SpoIIE family protein phosphatase [Phycisphaerales bacterium]
MRSVSIRQLAAASVVTPVVAVAGILLLLIWGSTTRTAEALGRTMTEHAGAMVGDNVRAYLSDAVRVSDLYARRIEDGTLSTSDLDAWRGPMLQDLVTSPGVASICFGEADGRAVYLQRANGRIEYGLGVGPGENQCREFEVSAGGVVSAEPLRVYRYDPVARPWYAAAVDAGQATWTPVYFWFATHGGDAETGAGYARPVLDADGTLLGVLTIDVTLSDLSAFLEDIPIGEGGNLFLTDANGVLVAATEGAVTSEDGQRLALADSSSRAARQVATIASRVRTGDDGAGVIAPSQSGRVRVAGESALVSISAITPFRGLDWRLATVIPESSFMGEARTAQTRALLIAIVASIAAALVALRFSERLVQPVLALRAHMKRWSRGEYETPLELRAARELEDLSRDVNAAALDLRNHVQVKASLALANQVQHSLLPEHPPAVAGLDLAGNSTYCDETGGDYYDFIDVHPAPAGAAGATPQPVTESDSKPGMMVVVGDVMGHGVAAALLMATARATLRLRARTTANLGRILTDMNNVLADDFQDGRFMTMAIALIEPGARRARWACAGHESPLVYEPSTDAFRTLTGGDYPLGVVPGTEFREYPIEGLSPGAILAIGTDGIWEAKNEAGEMFGIERLREIIRRQAGHSAAQIARTIDQELERFLGQARANDDVTYAIAKLV